MDVFLFVPFALLIAYGRTGLAHLLLGYRSPERWVGSKVLEKLRVHARNEGKVVRRMPDLYYSRRVLLSRLFGLELVRNVPDECVVDVVATQMRIVCSGCPLENATTTTGMLE